MDTLDRQIACYHAAVARYRRTRRRLYAELAAIERRMADVRASNPCPAHAPTACRLMSAALRELRDEWHRVTARLAGHEADDPDLI